MSLFRGFIAIEITPTEQITEFEHAIQKTSADVKLVEPENIHITLKFLGDTDETLIDAIDQCIKETAQNTKPFQITLQGTGVFPNQNYLKVIWIGINDGGIIQNIARPLDEKLTGLGFSKENKGYTPHLTIGRVRTAKNKDQLLKVISQYKTIEFSTQTVHSIILKKSLLTPTGPMYTTVREIKLG
jgi:RNA 2',3'-cyclic 3'-phosphodiesterase